MSNPNAETRNNPPTNHPNKDQGALFVEGVAGDLAAGVFNPATPTGSAVLKSE